MKGQSQAIADRSRKISDTARKIRGLAIVSLSTLLFACTSQSNSQETRESTTHVVEIRDFEFVPANVNVKVGDTIKWVNVDAVPHTATAADQSWDSGLLTNSAEWEVVVTKDLAGNYICTYHPVMTGTISVEN